MQFINPALALGALLFAVPLIIHLLNRQRFRKRPWAAMEYLIRAFKKQRRRLRIENLILLILRCLIPVLLAMALARPLFEQGGILPTIGSAHHILVFDRSYSMGYQPSGSQSPHNKAIRLATRQLEALEDKTGQKVTVVLAGVRPEVVVRGNPNIPDVRARLALMGPPTDSAESLLPALAQIAETLEDEKENPRDTLAAATRLYIFTDVQRNCFGDEFLGTSEPGAQAQPLLQQPALNQGNLDEEQLAKLRQDSAREILDRLRENTTAITVMDMGGAAGMTLDNIQITDLRLERAHAVAGVALQATTTVRNRSTTAQVIEVTMEKDNGEPTRRVVRIEAGADADVPFQVLFRETGMRQLKASIQADGLEVDNVCYRVVDVQKRLRVLLVEGSLADEWALMDSGWLRVILDPTGGRGNANVTEFETKVIDSTAFLLGQEKLQDYHMVVLANVARLSETIADDIKAAIEAGTGLFAMLGERCNLDNYNQYLYGDGNGPMPIRLQRAEGYDPGGEKYYRNQVIDLEHAVFGDFKRDEPLLQTLQLAGIYRYVHTERESLTKDGKVLWQISNPELSPLLVAGQFGEGRTLFLTSAITRQPKRWNTMDAIIHAVPLFHPLAHWMTHPATDPYNVTVGGSLTAIVRQRPHGLAVVKPERAGGIKMPLAKESRPLRGGLFALPAFTQTDYAGIYTFEMDLGEHGTSLQVRLPFAANPAPVEGQLDYLAHSVLEDKLGIENIHDGLHQDDDAVNTAGSSELGPLLLYLVLFFLLGEASWARFVSRRRGG